MKLHKIRGKRINSVSDADDKYKKYSLSKVFVPKISKLCTFELPLKKDYTLLFLDPYGIFDTSFPVEMVDRAFGKGTYKKGFTLGIIKQTGRIVFISAYRHNEDCNITIHNPFPIWTSIPQDYINRIDELKSKKRPFGLHIHSTAMYDFISQEEGFNALSQNIIFTFHLDNNEYLEVWGDSYRVVPEWK